MKVTARTLLFCLTLVIIGCQDELKRDYPVIKTLAPTEISASGATFSAIIVPSAGQVIIDHGFKWHSGSDVDLVISLGPTEETEVSYVLRSGLPVGNVSVMAFLKTAELEVHGQSIQFSSLGSDGPVVTDFSPKTAKAYDTITVKGRNFIFNPMWIGNSTFQYYALAFDTNKDGTQTKFVIPINLQGEQQLALYLGGQAASFPGLLTIVEPWVKLKPFPGQSRESAFSFSVNGKGYIGTGGYSSGPYSDFWEYNPVSDQWTQLANFPGGVRTNASSFVIGNKAYVGLGHSGQLWSDSQSDLWMFDPTDNSWTPKAAYPGGKRWSCISYSLNGKGYIGGGKNHQGINTFDFWEYDPLSNSWTQKSNLPSATYPEGPAHYLINGSAKYFDAADSHFGYHLGTNQWLTEVIIEGVPVTLHFGGWVNLTFDDRTLLLGPELLQVDVDTNTFLRVPFSGQRRYGGFGFVINGKGYFGLGTGGGYALTDVWEFDPTKW